MVRRTEATAVFFFGLALAAATWAADEPAAAEQVVDGSDEQGRSAVLVVHAPIKGQVFLSSVEETSGEMPAKDVPVSIRDVEKNEVICETTTDADGAYELPMLDVGRYFMFLGALRLNLVVEPEETPADELPKVIIFIIPEEMARKE